MLFFHSERVLLFSGALIFYLLMAFGGVFYFFSNNSLLFISFFLLICTLALFYFLQCRQVDARYIFLFFVLSTIFLSIGALRSEDPLYAFEKFDAFVIVTVFAFAISSKLIQIFGQSRFWRAFIFSALFLLFLTIIFKLNFGFFDRSVRFFINGPIVFGWLMGLSALVSYLRFLRTNRYLFLLLSGVFAAAVVWTLSKGPLLALLVASLYVSSGDKRGRTILIVGAVFLIAVGSVFFEQIWTLLSESRFSALLRIAQAETTTSDWGSVGIRQIMFFDAFQKFLTHPMLGIGLGNYQYEIFFYPHNEHLEVFLELGIFAGMLHLFSVLWFLYKSNMEYRAIIIFFLICSSFSGDMGYLRFIYVFGFIGVTFSNKVSLNKKSNTDF